MMTVVVVMCAQTVAGGRSRLHLLDLGSCSRSKDGSALSLSALGTVLLALFNGQRHLPYRYVRQHRHPCPSSGGG